MTKDPSSQILPPSLMKKIELVKNTLRSRQINYFLLIKKKWSNFLDN